MSNLVRPRASSTNNGMFDQPKPSNKNFSTNSSIGSTGGAQPPPPPPPMQTSSVSKQKQSCRSGTKNNELSQRMIKKALWRWIVNCFTELNLMILSKLSVVFSRLHFLQSNTHRNNKAEREWIWIIRFHSFTLIFILLVWQYSLRFGLSIEFTR